MKNRRVSFQKFFDFCASRCEEMFHEPEGFLKHPYLDPGGPYSKTLWDWDSFWAATALFGIAEKKGDTAFLQRIARYAKGSVMNFLDAQGDDGSLPILMSADDPDWFDSKSNPRNNMAKPVSGQFCKLLYDRKFLSDAESRIIVAKLSSFYDCYEKRYKHEKTGLYLWANDVAIGVDDDPATWGRPPFSSASIFLNCLLFMDLQAAQSLASSTGAGETALLLGHAADALGAAINNYCFDAKDGLYYSVDVLCSQNLHDHRHFNKLNINLEPFWNCLPLKVASWTSFMPLWCGLPDSKAAETMVKKHLMKKERFWTDYGIRTLAADERMYSPEDSRGNPSNWLGPVWIIADYIVWMGLCRYGFEKEAARLAENTLKLLAGDYEKNGILHEYYSPASGKGISGPGFMNWNLLACLMK